VLKLAIRQIPERRNSGRCCSTPTSAPVVSDRGLALARRNVASAGFCGVFSLNGGRLTVIDGG
jgi:hypothetical protein